MDNGRRQHRKYEGSKGGDNSGIQGNRLSEHQKRTLKEYAVDFDPYEEPFTIESVDDIETLLQRSEAGAVKHQQASFTNSLVQHAFTFFGEMKPEGFERMARTVVRLIIGNTKPRQKIRAARLSLRPINQAAQLMVRIEKSGIESKKQRQLLAHLSACLNAYSAEMMRLGDVLKKRGINLFEIMDKSRDYDTQVLAVETCVSMLLDTMKTLTQLAELRAKKKAIELVEQPAQVESEVLDQANSEMDEIEQRILKKQAEQAADGGEAA